MKKTLKILCLGTLPIFLGFPAFASILFFDDFDGTGNLHGTTPDTTVGTTTWVAGSSFSTNGAHTGRGSANLAFTPVDGFVYRAETWISTSSGVFWVGLGFANGQTTGGTTGDVFSGNNVPGRAWMQYQLDGQGSQTENNHTWLSKSNDGADWTSFATKKAGAIGMRIDLDTTGGAGNWTATYYAKENQGDAWTQVRAATTLTDEDITSVGFSAFRSGTTFTTDSFTLTQIPEPSTMALVLVAMLGVGLTCRRRK